MDDKKFRMIEARLDAVEADGLERKAAAARIDAFFALIATLTAEQRFSAEVASFRTRAAAAKQAEAVLVKERRRLDEQAEATRARLTDEDAALLTRLVAAESEAEQLHAAFDERKKLIRAWTVFGESHDVASGFASPRRPALSKARKAHGIPDSWQEDPSVPFDSVRPSVPSLFPSRSKQTQRPSRRV